MTSLLFPPRESLVVTSWLGKGNSRTFFLRCSWSPYVSQSCFVSFRWHLKGSNLPSVPTLAAPPSYPPLRAGSSHPNHPPLPPSSTHSLKPPPPFLSLASTVLPPLPPILPQPHESSIYSSSFSPILFPVLSCLFLLVTPPPSRARICKRLRSPGIYSKESIPPAYVARRVCTTTLFVSYRRPGYGWRNRFLGSFKFYQFGLSHTSSHFFIFCPIFLFFLWNLFHCHAPLQSCSTLVLLNLSDDLPVLLQPV